MRASRSGVRVYLYLSVSVCICLYQMMEMENFTTDVERIAMSVSVNAAQKNGSLIRFFSI